MYWSFLIFSYFPHFLSPVPQLCLSHSICLVVTVLELQLRSGIPTDVVELWEKRALPFTVGRYILKSAFSLSPCPFCLSSLTFWFLFHCKGQNEPQDAQCTAMPCRQQDDVRSRNPNSNITPEIRRKIPKKQERQHTKVPAIGSLWLYE